MRKLRPLLSAILGLGLLAQGFSVAAAAPSPIADETPAAAEQMPCHGDAQAQPAGPCPCCDSDCTDMTTCTLGHMAGAPGASLQFSPAGPPVAAAPPRATAAGFSPSRLRPPIVFHA